MDPKQLQNLIDGYMQGSLSSADQAEFDSRFASDPTFSEKVTGALGSHVGDAPNDFVDGVSSRLDARWETIFQKGTRSTDRTLFVGSGVLVAALVVLVGAGWYVWKTLGSSPDAVASQSAASVPKVVLSFKLPSAEASSWKPRMTFADAERDFTRRESTRSSSEKRVSPASQAPEDRVLSNDTRSSQSGQILRIRVEVPRDLQGRVTLWDGQGQMVRRLFEGAMPHGTWALDWDQKNDQGLLVKPGSYAVHIEAGGQTLTGQVIVTPGS